MVISGALKGTRLAQKLAKVAQRLTPNSTPRVQAAGVCFVAGTLVLLSGESVAIEDIQVGDKVLARDEATGEVAEREVVRVFVTPDQQVLDIAFEDGGGSEETVTATGEHPFWVNGEGWTAAQDLVAGQHVLTAHGGLMRVTGSTWRQDTATVYNFEVQDFHTYFVTDAGLWVHNTCFETRLPQDITVNPVAPRPLDLNRPISRSPTQNAQLQADIDRLSKVGARDFRVNQQQVNAQGQRVGINRPDLQYTDSSGRRVYVEYETPGSTRGSGHAARIRANDSNAEVHILEVP